MITRSLQVRKEAAYALCNACTGGSQQTLSGLVYHGVVAALCKQLDGARARAPVHFHLGCDGMS